MRVLVVDDDPEVAELVSKALARDGHALSTAHDLASSRKQLTTDFDVVVLDLGLPDGSGLVLCRELRQAQCSVPILLLTAQSAVAQRVEGLNAGADDYLVKPFALAELRARVAALGRRRDKDAAAFFQSGNVELELSRRRARRDGIDVELTAREWAIIEALAARRGRVVSRERLLDEVWGADGEGAGGSLEVLVGRIRRKLSRKLVRTVRGTGYALD